MMHFACKKSRKKAELERKISDSFILCTNFPSSEKLEAGL